MGPWHLTQTSHLVNHGGQAIGDDRVGHAVGVTAALPKAGSVVATGCMWAADAHVLDAVAVGAARNGLAVGDGMTPSIMSPATLSWGPKEEPPAQVGSPSL